MRRRLVQAAVLAGVLTGCSGTAQEEPRAASGTSVSASASGGAEDGASAGGGTAARSGGTIGADGSACELPVSFDVAEGWKPQAVDAAEAASKGSGDEVTQEIVDSLVRQGPVTAACEVDAKPAGNIGYLRVWTGARGGGDARAVLEAFVTAETGARKATYTPFTAGGLAGAEVKYLVRSELLDETKEASAVAVTTGRGPVVIHLGGLDTEEHRAMLPAYELAKRTLRAT
ncbi:lipoprotein [Streptomyces zinciresistens]|uniref:lipoprotein n=1 Tax=Streptomyces zinciresistens TaxID=1073330 RepID=UPI0031344855